MLLLPLDLTTALRPILLAHETLLFVQDGVGLYDGKQKISELQNGHVYLTSHRLCYVDEADPRNRSVAVPLKSIDQCEFYAGFFKSSPKVALFPKAEKLRPFDRTHGNSVENSLGPYTASNDLSLSSWEAPSSVRASPSRKPTTNARHITWICPICSFSNQLPTGFELNTASSESSTPPCRTCGIKPDFAYILKVAIAGASGRVATYQNPHQDKNTTIEDHQESLQSTLIHERHDATQEPSIDGRECPRCTYLNHSSISECEMCGYNFREPSSFDRSHDHEVQALDSSTGDRRQSSWDLSVEQPKVSFRAGGEKVFFEKLKGALIQRKWLLQLAPPIPGPTDDRNGTIKILAPTNHKSDTRALSKSVGIAGLESRGFAITKSNEAMLGTAFADLDALMASAKEVIALAETFAMQSKSGDTRQASELIAESASGLDMVTTKDMLGHGSKNTSLYLAELSRHLAEYLSDEKRGVLKNEGGIMTLVDLWAVFNQSRGGIELISPSDFEKAASLWGELRLPVRMRQFKSGLLLVQHSDRTDQKTVQQLLDLIESLSQKMDASTAHSAPAILGFGVGITAQEVAQAFGWSIGVASEELAIAEEHGTLCRDDGAEGVKYWKNWLVEDQDHDEDDDIVVDWALLRRQQEDHVLQGLRDTGLI